MCFYIALYYIQLLLTGEDVEINVGIFLSGWDFWGEAAEGSLLPGAHVGVDGHTVVRGVTQLLLTNLSAAEKRKSKVTNR